MRPEIRPFIAKYLASVEPLATEEGWVEKREVFEWNGWLFPITDNFPHWTAGKIREFARSQKLPIREIEVKVRPVAEGE